VSRARGVGALEVHVPKQRWWVASAVGLAAVVAAYGWVQRGYLVDDAFIFVRYARNIASGGGWAFNRGEPVQAVTSVLWQLLLTVAQLAVGLSPGLVVGMYLVCLLALALLVMRLVAPLGPVVAIAAGLLTAVCPILWESAGLETALAAGLVVTAALAHREDRRTLEGLAIGLAILARPDALLLAALLWGHHLWRERRPPFGSMAVAALVVGPWLVFSALRFGVLIPTSATLKVAQSSFGWWAKLPPFAISAATYSSMWPPALALCLVSLLPERALPRSPGFAVQAVIAYGLLHAAAYTAMSVASGYVWYYAPINLAYALGTPVGASRLATSITVWTQRRRGTPLLRSLPHLAVLGLSAIFGMAALTVALLLPRQYRLSREYQVATSWIQSQSGPADVIATAEIGYVGYWLDRPILDPYALIHPDALARIRRGELGWWIERRPAFVITHWPPWAGEPYREKPGPLERDFEANYRMKIHIPVAGKPNQRVVVWQRADHPAPPPVPPAP
jgi:hypothetical protein